VNEADRLVLHQVMLQMVGGRAVYVTLRPQARGAVLDRGVGGKIKAKRLGGIARTRVDQA